MSSQVKAIKCEVPFTNKVINNNPEVVGAEN